MINHLAYAFNVPPANAAVGVAALGVLTLTLIGTAILLLGKLGKSKTRHR